MKVVKSTIIYKRAGKDGLSKASFMSEEWFLISFGSVLAKVLAKRDTREEILTSQDPLDTMAAKDSSLHLRKETTLC